MLRFLKLMVSFRLAVRENRKKKAKTPGSIELKGYMVVTIELSLFLSKLEKIR